MKQERVLTLARELGLTGNDGAGTVAIAEKAVEPDDDGGLEQE